jgi:hypothetical protein
MIVGNQSGRIGDNFTISASQGKRYNYSAILQKTTDIKRALY